MRLRATRGGIRQGRELNPRTRTRILDGALQAIARHGLSKLGMSDVSESAEVSRGTLYRYFPGREELLQSLAALESERFQQRLTEALRDAPPGDARLRIALQQVTRYVNEHPAIQRLIENEPAFVLRYLRRQFPALCASTGTVLAPLLGETRPVRNKVATTAQLVDWLTRVMISAVLFPDPDPDGMAHGLTAVYGLLARPSRRRAAPSQRRSPRATNRKERRQ